MENVIEIKGNLHLYEVEIIPFLIEEIMNIVSNNGIKLMSKNNSVDNLEDIKMNFIDFLSEHKGKEVHVEGDFVFYSGKMDE